MTPARTTQALLLRLSRLSEKNVYLNQQNRILKIQIEDLEQERRRVDSKLVRFIRSIERWIR